MKIVIRMRELVAFLLHLGTLGMFVYTIYFEYTEVMGKVPEWDSYGGRWKFLTWWNGCALTLFSALSCISDVTNQLSAAKYKETSRLRAFLDTFFASLIWPMGVFVVILFWTIYSIDRNLMRPAHIDRVSPFWTCHVFHTYVLPVIILEQLLVYHRYPPRTKGLGITLSVSMLYLAWIFFLAFYTQKWVYGVLAILSWRGRTLFITSLCVAAVFFYLVGEYISHLIWKRAIKQKAL